MCRVFSERINSGQVKAADGASLMALGGLVRILNPAAGGLIRTERGKASV